MRRGGGWNAERGVRMFPSTVVVVLAVLLLCGIALGALVWAVRGGQFRDLDRQALLPLERSDVEGERPWETAEQARSRRDRWGPLIRERSGGRG